LARVQVSDETWTEYRATLGTTPVSVGLGRLVEREVARDRRRTAVDTAGVHDAVEDARAVARELAALISRLEPAKEPAGEGRRNVPRVEALFE